MNIKISLTILGMILGIAATGLVTALTTTTTQEAEAKINPCRNEDFCESGGGSFNPETQGGQGGHSDCDVDTECETFEGCEKEVGGEGVHFKGEGND
jgi:hypothetical protein